MASYREISNGQISVRFDAATGSLVSLRNQLTGTELVSEPRLGASFRLLVPLPDYVANYVFGTEQATPMITINDSEAVLHWNGVTSVNGRLDIGVTMRWRLTDAANVTIEVDNRSPHIVEEVWGPIVGGFQGVGDPAKTILLPDDTRDPWRNFRDEAPNWGYPWPCRAIWYPRPMGMQFVELHNGEEGLYISSEDASGQTTCFHLEKQPHTDPCNGWIPPAVASGIHIAVTKHPFVQSGARWVSPNSVIWPHRGDWHAAADRYRAWALTWMKLPSPSDWVRDFTGWQHTIMYTQSDAIHHRFADVPALSDSAKKYDFPCINLVGFHVGGIERGYPDFSPEPRLGGEEGLRAAIDDAHKKGVRVLLFSKNNRAHANTERFKKDLIRLATKDRDGEVIQNHYGYDTLDTRIIHQSRGRYAIMCPAVKEWQDLIIGETIKMAKLGADGTQYDQICSAPVLCYDPTHNHNPGTALAAGNYEFLNRLRAALDAEGLDFVICGEEPWDALYQWVQIGYCRHKGSREESRLRKYTFPETIQTVLIDMYDFDRVNFALMLGYPLDFEIKRWRGSLADASALAAYAQSTNVIRRELAGHLMNGVFRDRLDAEVAGSIEYGVHRATDGSIAVVLMNDQDEPTAARVAATDRPSKGRLYRPGESPIDYRAEQEISVPAHGTAVVVQ
ncbi:MAG: hypothetical protein EPO26_02300 [Chloroflexota bacterium]|nr:MAG: hypothetical protein EPO26_02300 [Chloroflexota bacterium]